MSFLLRLELGAVAALFSLGALLWANIRFPGSRATRWNARAFQATQIVFLMTALMDWAYGPYLASPFGLAWMGYPLIALPYAFAALALWWSLHDPRRYGALVLLAGAEFVSIIPILIWIEDRITFSFLAHGTIIALMSSALSTFVLVGFLIQDVPDLTSRHGRIVFLRREVLLRALPSLAQVFGLRYEAPRSILEAGSLEGTLAGGHLGVDSSPSLWPPRYRLRLRFDPEPHAGKGQDAGAGAWPPPSSGTSPVARALAGGWRVLDAGSGRALEYVSNKEMPFEEAQLAAMIDELTGRLAPSDGAHDASEAREETHAHDPAN